MLGPLRVPNRVLLAPLAGIGNWFVRLQAKRYGAGMAVSEMVTQPRDPLRQRKTCVEMLRDRPARARRGAGLDPAVRRGPGDDALGGRAGRRARAPTRSTSTWAAPCPRCARPAPAPRCWPTPTARSRVARARRRGSRERRARAARDGQAALRAGGRRHERLRARPPPGRARRAWRRSRFIRARPPSHHKGVPDYELAARLVRSLPAPVILTGGLRDAASACATPSSRRAPRP